MPPPLTNGIRSSFGHCLKTFQRTSTVPQPLLSPFRRHYGGGEKNMRAIIGKREIVGFGFNGQPGYVDMTFYPCPAIRFREPNPKVEALREKEKGDWRKLSVDEKKILYRYSFCSTFSEMQAPTGEWKSIFGWGFLWTGLTLLYYFLIHNDLVYKGKPRPESYSYESSRQQMKRAINMQNAPHFGLASWWDYDKMDWKVKNYWTLMNPFDDDEK